MAMYSMEKIFLQLLFWDHHSEVMELAEKHFLWTYSDPCYVLHTMYLGANRENSPTYIEARMLETIAIAKHEAAWKSCCRFFTPRIQA